MEQLIIFLKAPRIGHVKTRLAQSIGGEAALEAYVRIVSILLGNLKSVAPVCLCHSPDDSAMEIDPWRQARWQSHPQGSGDLGGRLHRAFLRSFESGMKRVVIVGSDCPYIAASDIRDAWSALADNDLVLGPATDGGYWLVGLRQPAPELFNDMTWSTSNVLAETLTRARQAGLSVFLLRELGDIDTEQDWRMFLNSPDGGPSSALGRKSPPNIDPAA